MQYKEQLINKLKEETSNGYTLEKINKIFLSPYVACKGISDINLQKEITRGFNIIYQYASTLKINIPELYIKILNNSITEDIIPEVFKEHPSILETGIKFLVIKDPDFEEYMLSHINPKAVKKLKEQALNQAKQYLNSIFYSKSLS